MPRTKKDKNPKINTIAAKADKYDLYQRSVQSPEHEIPFIDRVFRKQFGRPAAILREDFCGTFLNSCHWVKTRKDRRAIGVDLDPQPLEWGRKHNLSQLSEAACQRVILLCQDVFAAKGPKADIVATLNYSFWYFDTRQRVREYFKAARRNLRQEGMLVLDMMGGSDTVVSEHIDKRKITEPPLIRGGPKTFTYRWEQTRFDPINHAMQCRIHFRFSDASRMDRAFEYNWRFWSIPEVRELLAEAGFDQSIVYWDVSDNDDQDKYRPRERASNHPAWLAYIIAVKSPNTRDR